MVMSRDQKAGQRHSVMIDNSSIERVEEFKYLIIVPLKGWKSSNIWERR